ncbi:hypothetical protein DL766_001173 [Monosporascus sp. MC13-8B]|uniref:Major facilitator superfamily (MFS) profile domain-containing protein n=1 Tax=Monosporascus cannonballus TaxID=155416 RepID=A0ABY0HH32_9PEZI|nr:hypothetical protein DL762_002694 [Monosporascus cannonballus]RYO97674.1 hypothetical protein DL763_002651 [Monosporascus cannonballus]RYP38094.1 hypothetical protein DL766_001173 [Monosporascus sp. MC13-8B]
MFTRISQKLRAKRGGSKGDNAGFQLYPSDSEETSAQEDIFDPESRSDHAALVPGPGSEGHGKQSNEIVISWNGPDDPEHPLNWAKHKKWVATILVSCFTFISPFSSTMVTPALGEIGSEWGIPDSSFTETLIMSIFLLGYAQGPFVLAPLSEIYGRVEVLQYANLIYLAFNTACGFARSKQQMLAFRFLSGIGGSAPQALCNGVLADVWRKEERGLGLAIYGMLTFISPCVAPIVGGFMSEAISWRWIFWVTSMFDVVVQVAAFLFLNETYAPRILGKKAAKLRKKTGNQNIRTEYDNPDKTLGSILRRRLILPFIMFFTHPAVQAPSLYRAFLYGVQYLVLATFSWVWTELYNVDAGISSLHYLALCIGFIIGLQISHPLMDGLYAKCKKRYNDEEGKPEWRTPPMLLGGLVTPVGLLIYGWGAEYRLHWAVLDVGVALLGCGLIIAFQASQAYITDAYGASHAASASAVGAFTRTMCGFSFPLFAHRMYDALGLGWGNTLLALLTLALAVPSPVLLWFYGHKIREWSRTGL